jgi:hypothetical protein
VVWLFHSWEHIPRDLAEIIKVETCGIDPRKEGELKYCSQNDDGSHHYEGFYHFVGKIQGGVTANERYRIDNFEFAITIASSKSAGVAVDFQMPVVELAFQADVPLLLDESPITYRCIPIQKMRNSPNFRAIIFCLIISCSPPF